jgi:hypothetical protein
MAEDEKGDLGGEYEVNSHRAHISAYVLIAGLILELANAIIWYRGPETLAEMAAVLLIVSGVWGEVFFANRARIAGDKQLAEYQTRTAEAQLEAEKLKAQFAWRFLPLEKMAELANKLRVTPASVQISYLQSDPECQYFAKQWWAIFRMAKWPVEMHGGTYGELWFGMILAGGAGCNDSPASLEATALVMNAISEAEIGFNIAPIPRWTSALTFPSQAPMGEKIARMFIGPRQPTIG